MYDAIVIGARVAGSPTAMLLTRKGYRVLLVDKATFPSDIMSTHQIQIPGSARLKRWGLLDKVQATGCPPARHVRFDATDVVLHGAYPAMDGVDAIYSPRRYLLDKILVDAAVDAGAELREGYVVQDIMIEEGRVIGIRGHGKDGTSVTEKARIVIGADGHHSLVAHAVQAPAYNEKPPLTCGYYTYYADVPVEGGEIYSRDRRAIGAWPTNHGLIMIFTAWPVAEFHDYRADIEGSFLKTVDLAPNLAERVRNGQRAERFVGTADLPNFFRKPYGPGWALVGDAGYDKDPITAYGIHDAFRDADLLAEAIDAGFSGRQPLEAALAGYEQARNAEAKPLYDWTTQIASFAPPGPEQRQLLASLRGNQAATTQFFGMMTGVVPMQAFFAPSNLMRIMGASGMTKVMLQKLTSVRKSKAVHDPTLQV